MKKLLTIIMMFFVLVSFAQKKANGKIYIEHPALEIAKKFDEAFVKGDLETIKSLVSENFFWRHGSMRGKSGTLEQLLSRSAFLSKNIANFDHWQKQKSHLGTYWPGFLKYLLIACVAGYSNLLF